MSHRERGHSIRASRRRDKYSSRACRACQHRKSKCSGHVPCLSCQDRNLPCTYGTQKRRGRQPTNGQISEQPGYGQGDAPGLGSLNCMPPVDLEPNSDAREAEPMPTRSVHVGSFPSYQSARFSLYRTIGTDPNRLSLRSQIAEARGLFSVAEVGKSLQPARTCNNKVVYSIELPDPCGIQRLVHRYFEVATVQYPALHPDRTRARIHQTLEYLQYPSSGYRVDVDEVAAPTVALLCTMIAISASASINTSSSSTTNDCAAQFLNHARKLLHDFEFLPPSREILQCHTLITIHLLHMDFLDLAIQSSAVTTRLALLLRLHRRQGYSLRECDSAAFDQNLWWTVYILDRNIAYLTGTPGIIRDEDIDAPSPGRDDGLRRFSEVRYTTPPSELLKQCDPDGLFLEVLAYVWRLWGRIWNDLAPDSSRSQTDCHWEGAEIIDAQLRVMQQRLPTTLVWRHLPGSDLKLDEGESLARQRQLVIFMRINTLRLLTRRNPSSHCTCVDRKSPHSNGTEIAAETIGAIADGITPNEVVLPIGQLTSTTLVECILYLVHFIRTSTNPVKTETASTLIVSAYKVLVDLSSSCLSARNAVIALDLTLFEHGETTDRAEVPRQHAAATLSQDRCQSNGMDVVIPDYLAESAGTLNEKISEKDDMITSLRHGYKSLDGIEAEGNT